MRNVKCKMQSAKCKVKNAKCKSVLVWLKVADELFENRLI